MSSVLLKRDLVPNEVPDLASILSGAEKEAKGLTIGTTLFMKKYGVKSEAEYKIKLAKQKKVMHHAHIGWNSWEETAKGFRYIYEELKKKDIVLDRFGIALDWVMGVPENMRSRVMKGGSLIFNTPDEWAAVGQVVPIQPHFGDHMIGSLNSTENAKLALHAGVTCMGNIAQYYTYEYPGVPISKEDRVINMCTAIALMGLFRSQGAVIHSNLDDGFGAMFHDLANMTGWAMMERYLVEELLGGRLSHCFGNLFSDPMLRIIFLMVNNSINKYHTPGSMMYGNTIDFSNDYDRNYAALSSFVLADSCAELLFPSGHAVTPIPITEAIRIPSADEIIQVHVTANMLEKKAQYYKDFLDIGALKHQSQLLIEGGKIFFERLMNGMDDIGIDIGNPCEMFIALKNLGPAKMEELYGAGKVNCKAMRGHIPIKPTDIVANIGQRRDEICKNIENLENSLLGIRVVVAATDVHEFGKEIVKAVMTEAGATVFDLGANVVPDEIADTVIETGSTFVLVSTFNGIALTYGKTLVESLNKRGLKEVQIIMGGLLNENMKGEALPIEVDDQLTQMGIICSKSADELVNIIKEHAYQSNDYIFSEQRKESIMSTVSIIKTKEHDSVSILAAVRKALEAIGGIDDIIKPGFKVLINPNLVAPGTDRFSGAVTRYEVCQAIYDICKEKGADPFIAESSAAGVDTEKVIEFAEYTKLREAGYTVLDLKKEQRATIHFPQGEVVQQLDTWQPVVEADAIISVPVMKTHDQTEVTLGIKNLKGLIQDTEKKEFHKRGVFGGVVDINACIPRVLTVVDGIVGQQGLGPIFGEPVPMDLIIASKDCVACDAVTGAVMGYAPDEVKVTKMAHERGLGEMNLDKITIVGETLSSVQKRFKRASEVEIDGVPPFVKIEDDKACTGCKTTMISAIMDMKAQNIEDLLEGKTIVLGPVSEDEISKDVKKEDLVLMGVCTKHLWDKGTPCKGCPPNNAWFVQAVAGDRMQVQRRYATDDKKEEM